MGIFGFFAHKIAKKGIRKNIEFHKSLHPDHRAEMIFYVWLSRGLNLSEVAGNPSLFIPIYYYAKGAESVLSDVINIFQSSGDMSMCNAVHHHLYTNLAVSYPGEGYGALVREMWRRLFENYTNIKEVVAEYELTPLFENPGIKKMIENNDVTVETLINDVNSIMPHFLVPGHPLSVELLEKEKMGKYILGK